MASVRSRIPHGRSSRIPGSGIPKSSSQSRPSNQSSKHYSKSKGNHIVENYTAAENYRLTFNANGHNNARSRSADVVASLSDSDDSCEIVSLPSAEASPAKDLDNDHFTEINGEDRLKRNNPISSPNVNSDSPQTSFVRPGVSTSNGAETSEKPKQETGRSKELVAKSQLQVDRLSSLKNRPRFGSTRTTSGNAKPRVSPKNDATSNRLNLPPSAANLSAANAMEYVKKITSPESTTAERKMKRSLESRANVDLSRGAHNVTRNENHISTANRTSSSKSEKPGRNRAERRILYQEAKEQRGLRNNHEAVPGSDDVTVPDSGLNGFRPKPINELRRPSGRSPKIARPVARPPRRKAAQVTELPDNIVTIVTTPDPKNIPRESEESEKGVASTDPCLTLELSADELDYTHSVTRRRSVPASNLGRLSHRQQRRRASDAVQPTQVDDALKDTNYERSSFGSGDAESSDAARRKERMRQNERYKEILANPDIVTFGQYRLQQEGNYAPEEKYGATERRRIRSSTDSDSVSPCKDVSISFTGDGNTASDVIGQPKSIATDTDTSLLGSNDVTYDITTDCSQDEHEADLSDLSMMNDLPSIDSTTMMADYSTPSSTSTPRVEAHVANHLQSNKVSSNLVNQLCSQDLPHSMSEPGNPHMLVQSSPLRSRAASDDIDKFGKAAAAASNEQLCSTIDELYAEYKHVRVTLEQLYTHLNEEEEEKEKLEEVVEKLRSKNSMLTEEINQLTRILEFQHASPVKQRVQRTTHDAETQTEEISKGKVWFKSEMKAMKNDISIAVDHFEKIKDLRNVFEESVSNAEARLEKLLAQLET